MSPLERRQSSQGPNTPEKSPLRRTRTMPISVAQKQALIDNLQLESTSRPKGGGNNNRLCESREGRRI